MRYAKVFITAALLGCRPGPTIQLRPWAQSVAEPRLSYAQLLAAAQDALAQGHADAAATLAQDACRLAPERPEAYLVQGQALAQNDHVTTSSQAFERARTLGCRDAALFSALASNYDVEQRYQEAEAVYLDYLSDHPRDASMRDELGLTLLLLGNIGQAVAQLQKALQQAPENLQIRQDLGYALLAARAFADAETHLAAVCQAPAAPPEAWRLWAQALAGQGKWQAALQVVDRVIAQHPLDSAAQTLRTALLTKVFPTQSSPTTKAPTPLPTPQPAAQAEDTPSSGL